MPDTGSAGRSLIAEMESAKNLSQKLKTFLQLPALNGDFYNFNSFKYRETSKYFFKNLRHSFG